MRARRVRIEEVAFLLGVSPEAVQHVLDNPLRAVGWEERQQVVAAIDAIDAIKHKKRR